MLLKWIAYICWEGRGMLVGMGESPQQSVSALSGRVLHGATLTWKIPSHRDLES